MSLLNNNNKKGAKKGNKSATGAAGANKFNAPKPGAKGAGAGKRPIKTGGTRGS